MKKITILSVLVVFVVAATAQDNTSSQEYRTLFGNEETSHGGYGGLSVNFSQIDGKDALLVEPEVVG